MTALDQSIQNTTDSELAELGEFFADELAEATGRQRWLVEQTIVLASALIVRRGASLDSALAQARDAVLTTLNDEALLRSSIDPLAHSAVARLLLPRLRGYRP